VTLPRIRADPTVDEAEDQAARDVDAVLRRLPPLSTYAANVFRLTGVPADAGSAAVRRRREEVAMAARLGTPVGNPFGELAPRPEPDADTLKAAFESMQSPVTRLVHEAFWLSGRFDAHDEAVTAHCRAIDAETNAATTMKGRPAVVSVEGWWRSALAAWAVTLADPGFWGRLESRARELDDPRVGPATVEALRARLPHRVLTPNALLAVAAAGGDGAVDGPASDRHLRILRESGFDDRIVTEVLRAACEPIAAAVQDGCAQLLKISTEAPAEVPAAARQLLDAVTGRLDVPGVILPAADPLPATLHDEVAGALTRAVVAHVNAGGDHADVLELLVRAKELAREITTIELVDRTVRDLSAARVLAVIEPWCTAGDPDGATEVLGLWLRRERDPQRRSDIERVLVDPRAIRAEMAGTPGRTQFIGCGVRPYGRRARVEETWVETRCTTVFWAPVRPLGAYLCDDEFVYAKVPMSAWARAVRLATAPVLVWAIVLAILGVWAALGVAVATGAVLAAASVLRRRSIEAWLDEQTDAGPRR
jgi:hypothetical protein